MQVFKTPETYIQGSNVIESSIEYINERWDKLVLLADEIVLDILEQPLRSSFRETSLNLTVEEFGGECSLSEIDRLSERAAGLEADVIIGAGGGKALDTAKAIAIRNEISMISFPTLASNDSPTSAVSVVYSEEGVVEEIQVHPRHPDLVLVDENIIAESPTRFFVSGMGDALSTYFEAQACFSSGGTNKVGGKPTAAGMAIAEECLQILKEDGVPAKVAVESDLVTPPVKRVIEANILLSGLGFENGGLAFAHALHNGLTHLAGSHESLHGEKVAFGTFVQLVAESKSWSTIEEILNLCKKLGLPTTLEDLGLGQVSPKALLEVAEVMLETEEDKVRNEPVSLDTKKIRDSILIADEIGSQS